MVSNSHARLILFIAAWFACPTFSPSQARTLVLDGALTSSFHVKDTAVIAAPSDQGGIEDFTYHLVPPPTATSKTSKQTISNYRHTATPPPTSTKERTDPYGNKILELNWKAPSGEIKIVGEYDVKASVELPASPAPSSSAASAEQPPAPIATSDMERSRVEGREKMEGLIAHM